MKTESPSPYELVRVVKETVLRSVDASREGSIPSARIKTFYTDDRVVKVTVSRSVDASLMGSNPIPCTFGEEYPPLALLAQW